MLVYILSYLYIIYIIQYLLYRILIEKYKKCIKNYKNNAISLFFNKLYSNYYVEDLELCILYNTKYIYLFHNYKILILYILYYLTIRNKQTVIFYRIVLLYNIVFQ